jgi:PAS domain S-box-containing protein/putative nucleotidyltransferase with HDIG domain
MRAETAPMALADMRVWARTEGNDLFEILFDYAPDAYYLSDTKGRFIDGNKAAEGMIGYRKEALIGKSFVKMGLISRDQVARSIALMVKNALGKPTGPDEFKLKRKDGTEVVAEIRTYPVIFKGKTVILGIARDITERLKSRAQLEESHEKLRKSRDAVVQALMMTVDMRDPGTAGHQKRVAELAVAIAGEMALRPDVVETIRIASLIHDMGKVAVPAEILNKPGRLDDEELELIHEHPRTGYEILRQIDMMETIAEIVYQHHERLNGTGYPRGLGDPAILLETRILSVAEVMEAMSSHRPYRPALGAEKALRELSRNKDILYDRDVVDACVRVFAERKFEFSKGSR